MPCKSKMLFAMSQLSPRLGDWVVNRMTVRAPADYSWTRYLDSALCLPPVVKCLPRPPPADFKMSSKMVDLSSLMTSRSPGIRA